VSALPKLLTVFVLCAIGMFSLIGIPFVALYIYLVFFRQAVRIRAGMEKCRAIMMIGEKVSVATKQLRIHALLHRRRIAIVTDSRFVRLDRGLFGGYDMVDFQWKDLRDATITENFLPNIFGSDVSFRLSSGELVHITGLKAVTASKVYAFAQRQEQAWEEKRRIRKNEDVRAASGGIYLNGTGGGVPGGGQSTDVASELRNAKQMLDEKLISDAEFEEIKSRLLSRL
jgi:hypothetical protein